MMDQHMSATHREPEPVENGLDEKGKIQHPPSLNLTQPEYCEVVQDAIDSALARFPDRIHSMYLYGSVGRGAAVPYHSDLDVSAILYDKPSAEDENAFVEVANEVCARHQVITKLDYDVGSLAEIQEPGQEYCWHYWLKQCSVNLWGEDLTTQMAELEPSKELALGINSDVKARVAGALRGLTPENSTTKGQAIAKKLLRAAFSLVSAEDGSWHTDVSACGKIFTKHKPEFTEQVQESLRIIRDGASEEQVRAYLDTFGTNIIRLFENESRH